MPQVGFETWTPVFQQEKTVHAATVLGCQPLSNLVHPRSQLSEFDHKEISFFCRHMGPVLHS
jgi:hypothetical protein